jgi:hypothetical protein
MGKLSQALPQPGQKWLVRLQPAESSENRGDEATVTLKDFDPRTNMWMVQEDDKTSPVALAADCLIRQV